jgi:hypothetical protein
LKSLLRLYASNYFKMNILNPLILEGNSGPF